MNAREAQELTETALLARKRGSIQPLLDSTYKYIKRAANCGISSVAYTWPDLLQLPNPTPEQKDAVWKRLILDGYKLENISNCVRISWDKKERFRECSHERTDIQNAQQGTSYQRTQKIR